MGPSLGGTRAIVRDGLRRRASGAHVLIVEPMTEILTESFCERCGTRYTFETTQRRSSSLGRLGTIGRGLKHFVIMTDSSLDEAMAVARSEAEAKVTTAQLEVFHRTFNFCLQCRQYTCAECWNAVEGRCLSCAPMPVEEPAAAVEAIAAPLAALPAVAPASSPPIVVERAPTIEILPAPAPELAAAIEAEPAQLEAEPAEVEGAPAEAEGAPAEAEPEATSHVDEPEREPLAEPETEPEPGRVESVVAEPLAEPEPVPVPESEPIPEAASPVEPEPETTAAIPAAASNAADAAPFPGFQPGRSLDDEIAAYELRIAALAAPLAPEPPIEAAAVRRSPPAAAMATAPVQPAEVAAAPAAVQPSPAPSPGTCQSCGLSISASARFCRRCGARQDA